jgi:putative ABC transport system substrate-binding protein
MRRRTLASALAATIAATIAAMPLRSFAQQSTTRRFLIGWLTSGTPASTAVNRQIFDDALREQGFVEGRDAVVERRYGAGKADLVAAYAAELVRLQPDLIVAQSNREIAALKLATATIPIVMTAGQDPVGAGFIGSLARPGGNITGVSTAAGSEILAKRLQLMKEILPTLQRVAVLRVVGESAASLIPPLERAAGQLGITLSMIDVNGADDLDRGFDAVVALRAEALFLSGGATVAANMQRISDFALKQRLPGSFAIKEMVRAGLLTSYGVDNADQHRRAALYVAKILRGAKAADLPVEQPVKLELAVNMRTARAIGVKIPQAVLLRADEIVE